MYVYKHIYTYRLGLSGDIASSVSILYVYTHTHTHTHTYTYRLGFSGDIASSVSILYIYIYTHTHTMHTYRLGFSGDIVSSVSKLAEMERIRPNNDWSNSEMRRENDQIWSTHRKNCQMLEEVVAVAARYHNVLDDMDIHQTAILERMFMRVRELTVK